jgi:hypothetical protein
MSELTGRYMFDATWFGSLAVMVEEYDEDTGYQWRRGKVRDLAALEPAVADGWRFVEERRGVLLENGKRDQT